MQVELNGHYNISRLVKTSAPIIAMMIVTSVYSIVDGYFISNYAGSTSFAAMNIIWPAISLVSALGLMLGTGGSALVSKTLGEGDTAKAGQIFSTLIYVCIGIGLIMTVALFICMKKVVILLGAEGDMIQEAVRYGRIVLLAMPAFIMHMAFESFYMVAEKPVLGTMVSIASGVVNIVFDALFVVVFGWGLKGAAIATAMGLLTGGLYPLWFFSSRVNRTQIKLTRINRIDWASVFKSCSNGMSEFVGNIALSIVSMGYNLQLMKYIGENGVSAYGIIMYVGFIFAAFFIGYNICVSQVISFNYGAGNKEELRSLLRKSLVLIAACGAILTLIAELTAPILGKIFVGYDIELYDLTVKATRIYMLSFLICGFNMFCSAWFTALNNGVISAIAAFTRTLVFELGTVMILPAIIGIEGIWLAVSIAEVLALILTASLIYGFRKRYL